MSWRTFLAAWLNPNARPLPGVADWEEPPPDCDVPGCSVVGPHRHLSLEAEPHRPHPAANAWPDNAVTITYRELRQLIALHLDMLAATMGRTAPWEDARRSARAMRDGETPLLIAEVLDR